MKILIDGEIFDSTETPILLVFDENEKDIFGMKRFVSAPEHTTEKERQDLIETEIKF